MITGLPAGGAFVVCDDIVTTVLVAQRPSLFLWPDGRAAAWCREVHPVVMVGSDLVEVDRRLRAGELACPCGGRLAAVRVWAEADGAWCRRASPAARPVCGVPGDACSVNRPGFPGGSESPRG
jgi:hypothetical protein